MSGSVFCDIVCELGEGPSFDQTTGSLFWCDIIGRKLLEKPSAGGATKVHALPVMASAIAAIDGDRQMLVSEKGLYVRDRRSGRLDLHTPIEADRPEMRSNDARVHPCGAFWIGTMPKDEGPKTGSIYWFFKGELRRLYPDMAIPNAICFSPDGRIAYFTDTQANLLMRVDCDPATGLPTSPPKLFLDWSAGEGGLDGAVVDSEGVLWNARWGAGSVDAWSPDGKLIKSVPVGAKQSSCPAFMGPGAARMAVTSARKGMTMEQREADPDGGKTFVLDIPVKGRFEPRLVL